jgi:hypothetical protein
VDSKPPQLIGRVSNLSVVFPVGIHHRIRAMDVLWPHMFRSGGLVCAVQQSWEQGTANRRGLAHGHRRRW